MAAAITLMALLTPASAFAAPPDELTEVGGKYLYFAASDGVHGRELWIATDDEPGAELVEDISGSGGSRPKWLTEMDGKLYFQADDGVKGEELWVSDGTLSGTKRVKDINSGILPSDPSHLVAVGDALFFAAKGGDKGVELWTSDGTKDGTRRVKDIRPGNKGSKPEQLVKVGDRVFFTADDGTHGRQLWVSDGSENGTKRVRDEDGDGLSYPDALARFDGSVYLEATDSGGAELWKSDGSRSGTKRVKNIRSGSSGSYPFFLTPVGGLLFFIADDGVHGNELWRSDGTANGTRLVEDVRLGPDGSVASNPVNTALQDADGLLFLTLNDGGFDLWKSDGTAGGTRRVKDMDDGGWAPLASIGSTVYFVGNSDSSGSEIWSSTGTSASTILVKNVADGALGSVPSDLTPVGDHLYFVADDGAGRDLWITDGTDEGTLKVIDLED